MHDLILAILVSTIIMFQALGAKSQTFDEAQEVSEVIYELVKLAPARKITKDAEYRYRFSGDALRAAMEEFVPPFLLSIKMYNESSLRFDVKKGELGEEGFGQQHGAAAKGCDLTNRIGQFRCTAKWLRYHYDRCGSWFGALSAYGTRGICDPVNAPRKTWAWKAKYFKSITRQIKLWLKFEAQREAARTEAIDDIEHYAAEKEACWTEE